MSHSPITFQATLLIQAGWVIDFLALTEKDSGLRHGAGKDIEIRGRIMNSLLTESPAILGLSDTIKGYSLPHREAAINYLHFDLEAMIDPSLPDSEQLEELITALRDQDPILEAKNIREREYVKEPPVKPIAYSVNIGVKGKANTLEVILPALNSLDAQNHAMSFVVNHRDDIDPSDIFAFTALPSTNAHADIINQGFPDYKGFPNRTTHDVFQWLESRPDLLKKIHTVRDPRKDSATPLGLSKKDINSLINTELSKPGGDLDICPEVDGSIHTQALHDHLNKLINNMDLPDRSIADNRDSLAQKSQEWFEMTPEQAAVLSHLSPILAPDSLPEHMIDAPLILSRKATTIYLALKAGKDVSAIAQLNPENYGANTQISEITRDELMHNISTSIAEIRQSQVAAKEIIRTPEPGFSPS